MPTSWPAGPNSSGRRGRSTRPAPASTSTALRANESGRCAGRHRGRPRRRCHARPPCPGPRAARPGWWSSCRRRSPALRRGVTQRGGIAVVGAGPPRARHPGGDLPRPRCAPRRYVRGPGTGEGQGIADSPAPADPTPGARRPSGAGGFALAALLATPAPAVLPTVAREPGGRDGPNRRSCGWNRQRPGRPGARGRGPRGRHRLRLPGRVPRYAAVLPPGGLRGSRAPAGGRRPGQPVRLSGARLSGAQPPGPTPGPAPDPAPWGLDRIDQRARSSRAGTPRRADRQAPASPRTSSTRGSRPTTTTSTAGPSGFTAVDDAGADDCPATARTSPARSAARRTGGERGVADRGADAGLRRLGRDVRGVPGSTGPPATTAAARPRRRT